MSTAEKLARAERKILTSLPSRGASRPPSRRRPGGEEKGVRGVMVSRGVLLGAVEEEGGTGTHVFDSDGDNDSLSRGEPEGPAKEERRREVDQKRFARRKRERKAQTHHFPARCSVRLAMNRSRDPSIARWI